MLSIVGLVIYLSRYKILWKVGSIVMFPRPIRLNLVLHILLTNKRSLSFVSHHHMSQVPFDLIKW